MADTPTTSSPSLHRPIPGPTSAAWREQALARAAELRSRLAEIERTTTDHEDLILAIGRHLDAAEQAAGRLDAAGAREHWWVALLASMRGASVERADSELDAAEATLLRVAPAAYVIGQLPAILTRARTHLPATDPRLQRLTRLAETYAACNPDDGRATR